MSLTRVGLLALALIASTTSGIHAQRSTIPPLVISDTANCVTASMRDALREDAYTPEIPGGWQIVVPLRGQPDAPRGVQSPPPSEDQDFVLDIHAVGTEAELPDLDPMSDFAIAALDGTIWYGQSTGYFWLLPSTTTRECFRQISGGRSIVG